MLSIIIVNYNTKKLLYQCLFALYAREYPFLIETILVDNGSHDGSGAMVRNDFPEVSLIETKENVGFARADNMALEIARGEYVLLLNSDTKVLADALPKLVTFLDKHTDVAVVSGRRTLLNRLFPNNRYSRKYLVSRVKKSDKPFEVDWVSGACLMVRNKVIQDSEYIREIIRLNSFLWGNPPDPCFIFPIYPFWF